MTMKGVTANAEELTSVIIDKSISIDKDGLTCNGDKISLREVVAVKYGWMPIRLDMYTIGSRYMLQLRSPDKTLQLNFRSWFGIGKKQRYAKFCALMDEIWDATVVRNRLTLSSKSNPSVWTNLYYTETENVHILKFFLNYRFGDDAQSETSKL